MTSGAVQNLWLDPGAAAARGGIHCAHAAASIARFASTLAIARHGGKLRPFVRRVHRDALATRRRSRGLQLRLVQFGETTLQLGWVLDPLTAVMLVMVTFVGTLIFIYSIGYMAQDENFTRFFCFLSLFAAAMLGLVIANSLLLLFICWELVGLASYLLIGFWYHKPSAAAAAKKAFITTRIGDIGFLLGMLWLYSETGTLLFYDDGNGCLEAIRAYALVTQTTIGGMAVSTAIALLIFCGAVGKSGQVPLHVWLPDAMEGPTPVSALIHAATMVAAGVFLVARVYPLMDADPAGARRGRSTALSRGHMDRRDHRRVRRAHRRRAKRHQTHPRLLHRLATRLHDDGPRRRRRRGWHVPSHHARVLQGAAVPRRRLGHSRLPRRAGHPPDGRVAQIHAGDVRHLRRRHDGALRRAVFLLRLLEQGRDPARRARAGRVSQLPFYLGLPARC